MKWKALGDIRLLVVDDDAFNRQLVISLLGKIPSIHFFQAEDGMEALDILVKRPVDMILLDLHMPRMDGFATLKVIKENPLYHSIPIAIITTDDQVMHQLYHLGVDDFISKPFKLSELEARIYTQIEKRQRQSIKKTEVEEVKIEVKAEVKVETPEETLPIESQNKLPNNPSVELTLENVEKAQLETFYTMAKLLQQKENNLTNLKVIMTVARAFALYIGYDKNKAHAIAYATANRNIGGISLTEPIPSSFEFSNIEKELYTKCIRVGYQLLSHPMETNFVKIAKKVIRQHKEHYNGSGFPQKLQGEEIHNVAYIASIVETFDGLLSNKTYHNNRTHTKEETYNLLHVQSGIRFHPQIIKLFLNHFDYFIELREHIINPNRVKENL